MKVNIQTLNGQKFQFEVRPGDKVGDVKQKLAISQQVGSDQIKLLFENKPLDNDENTMSYFDVKEGNTIHMVTDKNSRIEVTVEIEAGKSRVFSVDCNEQVDQLKAKIQQETELRADMIELFLGSKQIQGGKLMHHSVKNGSRLKLRMKSIQVTVKGMKGNTLANRIDISLTDTVDSFKSLLHRKTGTVPAQQRLIFKGKELDSGRMVDYNIANEDTIIMVERTKGG